MKKNSFKLLFKLLLTGLAIYIVFRKIDLEQLIGVFKTIQWFWLIPAALFFVLSKVLTAFRLNAFFRNLGLFISEILNLKLYIIAMFYNLFLPGGIGGDGYKVYLLNKNYHPSIKALLHTVLLDRLGGLVSIVFLIFGLIFYVDLNDPYLVNIPFEILGATGLILVFPIFYLIQRLFFKKFLPSFFIGNLYSLFGQIGQLICAVFILWALGVDEKIMEYLFIFLISSIVAVLPLTIGGVGARELVFIFSHEYIGIEKNTAVAFSLIFFLISAFVSLTGTIVRVDLEKSPNNSKKPILEV